MLNHYLLGFILRLLIVHTRTHDCTPTIRHYAHYARTNLRTPYENLAFLNDNSTIITTNRTYIVAYQIPDDTQSFNFHNKSPERTKKWLGNPFLFPVKKFLIHKELWFFLLVRYWECEENQSGSTVAGRLTTHAHFWSTTLKAPSYVLNIIRHGYRIPLIAEPPPFRAKNNASSFKNADFVDEAVKQLQKTNCIRELTEEPFCCNPLTVATGSKKSRLVLDLRHLNQYVIKKSFRYEGLQTFAEIFEEGDFFQRSICDQDTIT